MEARTTEICPKEEALCIIMHPGRMLPSSYHGVILARWLRSLRNLNATFKRVHQESYFKHYELYIKNILANPKTQVRLLVLDDDKDIVFGWCVYTLNVLHYIHIQEPYRGQKRSYDLLPKDLEWITHETSHWNKRLGSKRFKHLKYNPFL